MVKWNRLPRGQTGTSFCFLPSLHARSVDNILRRVTPEVQKSRFNLFIFFFSISEVQKESASGAIGVRKRCSQIYSHPANRATCYCPAILHSVESLVQHCAQYSISPLYIRLFLLYHRTFVNVRCQENTSPKTQICQNETWWTFSQPMKATDKYIWPIENESKKKTKLQVHPLTQMYPYTERAKYKNIGAILVSRRPRSESEINLLTSGNLAHYTIFL